VTCPKLVYRLSMVLRFKDSLADQLPTSPMLSIRYPLRVQQLPCRSGSVVPSWLGFFDGLDGQGGGAQLHDD
jgi:hypothetical protein